MNTTIYIMGILLQAVAAFIALLQVRHAPRKLPWLLIALSLLLIVARRAAILGQVMETGGALAAGEILTLVVSLFFFLGVVLMTRMFSGVWKDHVALQMSEATLLKATKRLEETLESISDAFFSMDDNLVVTYFNAAAERMLNRKASEVMGKYLFDAFPEAKGSIFDEKYHHAAADKVSVAFETYFDVDPYRHWYEVRVYPQENGISVYFQIITERKQAEEKLRESEQRFSLAMEAAKDGIWDWNLRTDQVYYSPGYLAMLGYTPGEVPADPSTWAERIHPEDKGAALDANMDCIENRRDDFEVEFRMQAKNGQWRWILGRGKAAGRDENGRAIRMVGTHTDITERARQTREIKLLNRLYSLLSRVSQAVVRATSPETFLEQACREVVECGGFLQAWIGHVDLTNDAVLPTAFWGRIGEYVRGITVYTDNRPEGRGPTGTCIRERHPVVYNDFLNDPQTLPWRDRAAPFGIASSAAFPIERAGQVWGALTIYSNEVDRFGHEDVKLLEKVAGDIGFALDNLDRESRRKEAEEALRESEERYRQIAENIREVFWIADVDLNRVIYVSPAYEKIWGRTCKSLYAEPGSWAESIHPDDRQRVSEAVLPGNPQGYAVEYRIIHSDESIRWVLDRGFPVRNATGEIYRVAGITEDITERKQAETERERLMSAIEQSGEAVVITNPQGTIQFVNPAFEQMTGYTREEALGRNPRILKSGKHDELFYHNLWDTISNGRTWQDRMVNKRKDGTLYTEESTISPVRDAAGRILNYVAVKRDITEHLHLSEQFRQAQKMESVGRLAGGVAHDFNNMLGVILGHSEMAMAEVDSSQPLYVDLQEIHRAAKRSADLTRQLLAFARKQTASPKVLNLNETVEGMLNMLKRLIGENIELAWLPDENLWPVKIDPSQIDQILANLSVNARDAIEGVGKLTIRTENAIFDETYRRANTWFVSGDYVVLTLSDDGIGMDEETRNRIFEPFFTTKEVGKGTGLGLATVYGIVKQNNGFIDVYSEPGQGTTFKIYLPRHAGQTSEELMPKALKISKGRGETVLVVEDEPAILQMTKTMLQRMGYNVLTASTPGEAMRLAEENTGDIHLLITDVVMPEMNGRDLALELLPLCPHLKSLFMSGYTADVIARQGVLDAGVNFIQKPFSTKAMAEKVREVLGD